MNGPVYKQTGQPAIERLIFSWAFYLFGMAAAAPTFALVMQSVVGPTWGDRFFRGWIDPALNLVAIPLMGAALGFVLVAFLNVIYVLARKRPKT